MSTLISDYFGVDFDSCGVFDAVIDADSHYFINVTRLKDATTPEFAESYQKINNYFGEIALLLDQAQEKTIKDRFYREALRRFAFSEVNGINLGFSQTLYGAAFGNKLRDIIISDAFDIVKAGTKRPEFFHLIGLFEDNVGPDRLSDMFATIIKTDIYAYTKRINLELGITQENFPNEIFKDGVVFNPYKRCDLLLIPKEILHELPIAHNWDDIDRVVSENETIRREINSMVGEEWRKYASSQKKGYLKDHIFKVSEKCARVLETYETLHESECDWETDLEYVTSRVFKSLKNMGFGSLQHSRDMHQVTSDEATVHIIDIFKDWVENNRGWEEILSISTRKREKIVQRLVHLAAKEYVKTNNLDISFESDAGNGPSDIKLSRGGDKSLCEIKLSSNPQYLHGYQKQVNRYAEAECTDKLFYTFIDTGNPGRLKNIMELHQNNLNNEVKCPKLIIIDSTKKESASTVK
ncbi:hypothetical protein [Qingrenia yutianensis]|uniref:Uncharacterized protein n=1 Tax=Qingrenia yutianensis TaxID=2763676 RepID=A0A926FBZ6_9FIRM|nr:hypothetical protein [Qingrenia yutianensis]MBC8596477.1 hypothetical protein [Qingrenia yutianensis]